MAWRCAVRMVWALGLALGAGAAVSAQTGAQSTDDALRAMEQAAGVIFAGQVIAVRPLAGADGSAGVVEIEFAVDDAVRGVSGGSYTLREWAGLFPGGDEPFRVGQQFLMLLYTPSAAGLSSPVGGMDGAIPIHGEAVSTVASAAAVGARVMVAADTTGADGRVPDGRVMDMRWVQTWVVRPLAYRAESVARPITAFGGLRANMVASVTPNPEETASAFGSEASISVADTPRPAVQASEPYTTVLGKLRGWARSDHGSR
jgi:hypothetical protein